MRFRELAAGVIAAVAALTLDAVPHAPASPPQFAELVYSNGGRIYSLRADGSGRQLLVGKSRPSERAGYGEPAWSPDGTTLVFTHGETRADDDIAQLMVSDEHGVRPLTPLRRGRYDGTPTWSPDGRRIAFVRYVSRPHSITSSIVIMGRDGTGARTVARESLDRTFASINGPAWLPNGREIAYSRSTLDRHNYFHSSIYTVGEDGAGRRRFLREAQTPAWSREGSALAFISIKDRNGDHCGSDECSYNGELYVARADGSGARRLTRNTGDDGEPDWSPDGQRILFSSDRNYPDGESPEVYSIARDGSCLTWLTNGTPGSGEPAWRPGSVGLTDPGRCGSGGRRPLVEIAPDARAKGNFWLGTSYRGLLLSDYDLDRHGAFFDYDDCGRYSGRRCPSEIQVSGGAVCKSDSYLFFMDAHADVLRQRGTLVAYYGPEGGAEVFAGRVSVGIPGFGDSSERRFRRELRAVIDHLGRVGRHDRPGTRLPRPQVPGTLARKLRAALRAKRRYRSDRLAARALGIRRSRLRARLRLARALRSFGGIRATHCPRR